MFKICIDDNLLVWGAGAGVTWGYRIVDVETATVIASETTLTVPEAVQLVPLTLAIYEDYIGKTLLLEITNNVAAPPIPPTVVRKDTFLISGIYCRFLVMKKLTGLLGENHKKEAADASDFEEGNRVQTDTTVYSDSALSTVLQAYDWDQSFVTDFIPDARFHTQKIKQKEV